MIVYLVKHHAVEAYVASVDRVPRTTAVRDKSYRFVTTDAAKKAVAAMKFPLTWGVISATFSDGKIVAVHTEVAP